MAAPRKQEGPLDKDQVAEVDSRATRDRVLSRRLATTEARLPLVQRKPEGHHHLAMDR